MIWILEYAPSLLMLALTLFLLVLTYKLLKVEFMA